MLSTVIPGKIKSPCIVVDDPCIVVDDTKGEPIFILPLNVVDNGVAD